jgi:(p)ppGpp synthase/HD superfamily hydrolase
MAIRPDLIELALVEALTAHRQQKRKGDGMTPYIVHPVGVAIELARYTHDQDILIAAILHDVLEDTDYSPRKLGRLFGRNVLRLVKEVTDKHPRASWQVRKNEYLKHLSTASRSASLIACADKINNVRSIVTAYQRFGDAIWKRFAAAKEEKIKFYEEVARIVGKRFPNPLEKELRRLLREAKQVIHL